MSNEREKRKVPKAIPGFELLENGDADYTPMVPIRVTEEGVFAKYADGVVQLENLTVADVTKLIEDRRSGGYQQYDFILISMNSAEKQQND